MATNADAFKLARGLNQPQTWRKATNLGPSPISGPEADNGDPILIMTPGQVQQEVSASSCLEKRYESGVSGSGSMSYNGDPVLIQATGQVQHMGFTFFPLHVQDQIHLSVSI